MVGAWWCASTRPPAVRRQFQRAFSRRSGRLPACRISAGNQTTVCTMPAVVCFSRRRPARSRLAARTLAASSASSKRLTIVQPSSCLVVLPIPFCTNRSQHIRQHPHDYSFMIIRIILNFDIGGTGNSGVSVGSLRQRRHDDAGNVPPPPAGERQHGQQQDQQQPHPVMAGRCGLRWRGQELGFQIAAGLLFDFEHGQ